MTFTKTGPQWAHAPQAEGDGTSALTESRMRQSLERLGGRSAAPGHSSQGHSFGGQGFGRPRRHGFVRDGEVPVEQARRRVRPDAAASPDAALQPRPGTDLQARITAAERAARESRDQAHVLATRLGHAELKLAEATRQLAEAAERAEAAEARLQAMEGALSEARTGLAAARQEAEHWRQTARIAVEAHEPGEPAETDQEPVQWWVEREDAAARDGLRD